MTATDEGSGLRLLLLISAFTQTPSRALAGLTKLAKLDFLLRYPAYLEVLNDSLGFRTLLSPVATPDERRAVSDQMIRFRYGPWDSRYYALLGRLQARALISIERDAQTVVLKASLAGLALAASARLDPDWRRIGDRVDFLAAHYDLPGNRLKTLIYDTFPAIGSLNLTSEIPADPVRGNSS